MSAIPLHLQRRFEQRWAARFVPPAASAALKSIAPKGTVKGTPRKATRIAARDRRSHFAELLKPA
jgi:hypothetical protein